MILTNWNGEIVFIVMYYLAKLSLMFAFFVFLHMTTDVTMNDRGLYSCNLHHLYCHLYEMVRVQLNVTKSRMYHMVQTVGISLSQLKFL